MSLRTALVLGATAGGGAGVHRLAEAPVRRLVEAAAAADARAWAGLTALHPEDLLAGLCALALVACSAAWTLGLLLTLAESALGDRGAGAAARIPCPRLARRLALAALGAGVWLGPPAIASDLGGLPLPDRVATTAPGQAARIGLPATSDLHVVRRGDTLWSIAASALPGAGEAQIDNAWRRIAAANRDRVDDPDLIFPGTELRVPPLTRPLGKDLP